jgi:hypothetical protein
MKKIFMIAALICLTVFLAGNVCALTLDFANLTGANIQFNGGTDTFSFTNNNTGYSFYITGSDSTGQSAIGKVGKITESFSIGDVTTYGSYQSAPVTGEGTLSIYDGSNTLTADITWGEGATIGNKNVTFGFLNVQGSLNLDNVSYDGSNTDLLTIKSAGDGIVTASFQFIPGVTLQQLKDGGVNQTSYSGSLYVIPIPGALVLLGAGLVRLVTYGRRKRGLA